MVAANGDPQLEVMRLGLLWHQNLMDPAPKADPSVIQDPPYRDTFDSKDRSSPLTPPWAPRTRQGFWERYLPSWEKLAQVPGRNAWRAQVPLRVGAPVPVVSNDNRVEVAVEGFLHPWGTTFVVELTLRGNWLGFAAATRDVLGLKRNRCFSLTGAGGPWVTLDKVAEAGLASLRASAGSTAGGPMAEPFSVFTLNDASGGRDSFDPTHDDVARFLHATSSFSPTWESDPLVAAADRKVAGISNAPASHLIYGQRRGRAIWSPEHFLMGGGIERFSTLECHHHNLVFASVQTEALSRFAIATAARIQANTNRSAEEMTQAKRAATTLGNLYEGAEGTYKSGSVKAQIAMNKWLDPINVVRVEAGLPKLT